VVVVVIALALFLLRDPIATLFALEQRPALALLYAFCGPLAILFYFNVGIFVSNEAFNNLGHPYYSTWINWGRHTIGTIPRRDVVWPCWCFGRALCGCCYFWSAGARLGAARDGAKPRQRERGANASGASTALVPFASLTLGPNIFGKGLVKGLLLIA